MTLHPDQFGPWFHGTGHWFGPGESVSPTDTMHTIEPRAYASNQIGRAASYAGASGWRRKADSSPNKQGTLFGPVFEVEPMGGKSRVNTIEPGRSSTYPEGISNVSDAAGMRVKRLAGFGSWKGELV